jgi:hypothetical protein
MDADVLAGREERGLFNPLGGPAPNFLKLCFIISLSLYFVLNFFLEFFGIPAGLTLK